MTQIHIDIETLPTQRPDILAEIRNGITAPAQYKKPESIEAWLKENGEQAAAEAVHKTGLDGAYGEVYCIALALDDEPPMLLSRGEHWQTQGTEAILLRHFNEVLDELAGNQYMTTLVGHNLIGFDLRFLVQRCIVNGVRPAPALSRAAQAKPWEQDKVYDTMTQWAGVGGRVSLDKLCRALSIPTPKDGIDGSRVWEFVQAGKYAEVGGYCMADVEVVRKVWQRMTFREAA